MRRVATASLWAAMLLVGSMAVGRDATARAAASIEWSGCGVRLECAQVQVPLVWVRLDGPAITLAVIRRLASDPEQRIGSLFINFGGPSGSVQQVRDGTEPAGALDAAVRDRFDVIGWDIRGADDGSRARCFSSVEVAERFFSDWALPFTEASSERTVRTTAALARHCFERSGELISHMSTADIVRDLDYLRGLVGDPQMTYVGISSGTLIGQTYAWWRWAPCASWLTQSANRYVGPWNAITTNPILVIGTRFDPNTPFTNAIRAARRLGNAVLLTHNGYSHTSPRDPSACVKRATSAYLLDVVTPPPKTVCPSDHAPFDTDFTAPGVTPAEVD
jgi:pimeloyl-ACP methyl ester carboxylesterase